MSIPGESGTTKTQMNHDFLVITNCTARKRAGVPMVRLKAPPACPDLASLVSCWRETLVAEPPVLPAGQLYVGRSINEAKLTARLLDARLFVVSAGLGLVPSDRLVPGYDLSVSGTDSGLNGLLETQRASGSDWWRELSKGSGLPWLLNEAPNAVVLVSLPTNYLELLTADFADLTAVSRTRLRVFTSSSGRKALSGLPDIPVMPYDERLESVPGFSGTRSDFPQRAMRHFVSVLGAHLLEPWAASSAVESSLESFIAPSIPARNRLDDAEICALIRQGWKACGGNSARLLRYLRDTQKVACEQGRFALLRRRVADELAAETQLQTLEAKNVI